MRSRRSGFAARLGLALAPLLAAVPAGGGRAATTEAPSDPKDGGVIVWLSEEPAQLNPFLPDPRHGGVRQAFERLTSEGLAEKGPDGTWVARLATKVPEVKDGDVAADLRTVTWKLRPGLLWSDGSKLTSDDLRFTWEVCHDPGNGCAADAGFDRVASVDTPDAETIVLHYKAPDFAYRAQFAAGVLPRHSADVGEPGGVSQWAWDRSLVPTTGPFTVLRWDPGEKIVLYRNPHYYLAGRPYLHRIDVDVRTDAGAALQALRAGHGDLLSWLPAPSASVPAAAKAAGLHLGDGASLFLNEIQLNLRDPQDVTRPHPILGDVRVRRALLSGIDVTAVLAGWNVKGLHEVRRITSPADLEVGGSLVRPCAMAPITYDPAAAKALLDQAGWTPGAGGVRERSGRRLQLSLLALGGADVDFGPQVAELVRELRVLGVDAQVQLVDGSVMFSDWITGSPLYQGSFDIAFYDWKPDRAGVARDFEDFYGRAGIPDQENPTGRNVSGIADPEIEGWLRQAGTTTDDAARRALYCRVADRVQNGLFAQEYTSTVPNWPMAAARLRDWSADARGAGFGEDVAEWYLAK